MPRGSGGTRRLDLAALRSEARLSRVSTHGIAGSHESNPLGNQAIKGLLDPTDKLSEEVHLDKTLSAVEKRRNDRRCLAQ